MSGRKTILVVDDTPDNIDLLRGLLRERFRVKAATSGEKALAIAGKAPPPDLVLLDVMMPGMDGFEVCERLKGNGATEAIPVIFVTGAVNPEDEARGVALGAVAFLSKPVEPDLLNARIAEVLGG